MKTVHFLFFCKAHMSGLLPLTERLREHSLEPRCVKGFDYNEYASSGAPFRYPARLPQADILDFASGAWRREYEELHRDVRQTLRSLLDEDAAMRFDAKTAARLCARVLRREDMPLLFRKYCQVASGLARFIEKEQPGVVVLPEDTDYIRGRLAIHLLKRQGVRTVVFMPRWYSAIIQYPLSISQLADDYLVLNRFTRQRLIRQGMPQERIHVLGLPGFHGPEAPRHRPAGKKLFLYALQGKEWERHILADLLDIFSKIKGATLLVKQHPQARNRDAKRLIGGSRNVALSANRPIQEILPRVSCVLGQTTLVLYEAAAMGLPVIAINYSGFPTEIFLPEEAAHTVTARNHRELAEKIRRCLLGRLPVISSLVPLRADCAGAIASRLCRIIGRRHPLGQGSTRAADLA